MKEKNSANLIWLFTILIIIGGNLFFSTYICNTVIWLVAVYVYGKRKKDTKKVWVGFFAATVVLTQIPSAFQKSLLMYESLYLMLIILMTGEGASLGKKFSLGKMRIREWIALPLLTILLVLIAGYVNGLSMIFFSNETTDTLQLAAQYFPWSILILAIVPACVEELIFRGAILQNMPNGIRGILVSSLLFALMHMNFNQMSYAFVAGILLAVVMTATENLSVSIGVHLLFNLYNMLIPQLMKCSVIQKILTMQVGGYCPWNPNFLQADGSLAWNYIGIGLLIMVIALLIYAGITILLSKKKRADRPVDWKPDAYFWAGCAICLFVAVCMEITTRNSGV